MTDKQRRPVEETVRSDCDTTISFDSDGDGSLYDGSHTRKKTVRFSLIEVRAYDRVVGDQTDLIGPPLSIGWHYEELDPMPVQQYEENRTREKGDWGLLLTPTDRRQVLIDDWGYTSDDLSKEERKLTVQRKKEDKQGKEKLSLIQKAKRHVKRGASLAFSGLSHSGKVIDPFGGGHSVFTPVFGM
eukprot:CAMPEP_0183296572 /NCGR_PEP_ID=MMETSP0160_2-20130417/4064_1 /TAXON_ID=2839 ORGANISM="Odontella Sinensis, Strain Grunow 1884" /NCGR_SAMPLE_ID=MMETSP0160_2 /ASSEMBLY_ACC=CAM_ASM_000250 /LENGTH=185 /DNA_ID=CAMNT_0025458195 /DNA_START=183 /DNA_END=740 /DNA_ORIENTATION=+